MNKSFKQKPWKKHPQVIVPLSCGVRCEVDAGIANLLEFLNRQGAIETRHSCEGRKSWLKGYISMFATPMAMGLAHYLLDHAFELDIQIETDIHPYGYNNLVVRWPKKNYAEFEQLVMSYFH